MSFEWDSRLKNEETECPRKSMQNEKMGVGEMIMLVEDDEKFGMLF
jgi:hypothetical protein